MKEPLLHSNYTEKIKENGRDAIHRIRTDRSACFLRRSERHLHEVGGRNESHIYNAIKKDNSCKLGEIGVSFPDELPAMEGKSSTYCASAQIKHYGLNSCLFVRFVVCSGFQGSEEI